jgi:hypothetical protein
MGVSVDRDSKDLAGDVALEAADDFQLILPLGAASGDVIEGGLVGSHADDDHAQSRQKIENQPTFGKMPLVSGARQSLRASNNH